MHIVIERGNSWDFEYDTCMPILPEEKPVCTITKRLEPNSVVLKPEVNYTSDGKLNFHLSSKDTLKLSATDKATKWDCYTYEVHFVADKEKTKKRIMQGVAFVVPCTRLGVVSNE